MLMAMVIKIVAIVFFFVCTGEESEVFDRSAEINEIDERLNRLQQLMKATMP